MPRSSVLVIILSIDVIAIIIALVMGKYPEQYFEEGAFITYLSFFQLLAASILAFVIFTIRKRKVGGTDKLVCPCLKGRKTPFLVWLIIAIAFVYLSLDEICMIHERLDYFIRQIFNIKKTGFTDRIDDIIVGCYGLLGLITLYFSREEFKKYKDAFPLLKIGFVFMFLMVALDILTNRDDILKMFISNPYVLTRLFSWLSAIEDMFKIIAEGVFVAAFYYCFEIARRLRAEPLGALTNGQ